MQQSATDPSTGKLPTYDIPYQLQESRGVGINSITIRHTGCKIKIKTLLQSIQSRHKNPTFGKEIENPKKLDKPIAKGRSPEQRTCLPPPPTEPASPSPAPVFLAPVHK
ncbi:hypothetical protein Dimus_018654 [Dionaea muscipula]